MRPEDEMRVAAGETDHLPPAPPAPSGLSDEEAVRRDMSYSPASETETANKQSAPLAETLPDDIDQDSVKVAPGTGGPDDVGEIEVDPDDLNLPGSGVVGSVPDDAPGRSAG